MGIIERPKEAFLTRLEAEFGFDAPREHGVAAIPAIEDMLANPGRVFVGMGGNFAQATSDTHACHEALRSCSVTVHISTKLNRSHLVHGEEDGFFRASLEVKWTNKLRDLSSSL